MSTSGQDGDPETDTAGLPRPPYDPELVALLDGPDENPALDFTIGTLRDGWSQPSVDEILTGRRLRLTERSLSRPDGKGSIVLAIFTPEGPIIAAPVIYHVHGGAMILGDRFSLVDSFFDLIEQHGVVVVSVEYRLSPEHPDPAPVEDCYAGLIWTVEHAEELGIDAGRVLIAGASAGGGLAAGVALMARDRRRPGLLGQLLMCPMLDDRSHSLSSRQYADVDIAHIVRTGWQALLGPGHAERDVSPYAAPGRVEDLTGLPPAFIDVGSAETLRDEATAYASRIWAAGGQAELHVWAGGFHGFQFDRAAVSAAARAAIHSWLERVLHL